MGRAYYDAFQIAISNGDTARSKIFAERGCAARTILEGSDSPRVRRLADLARDPTGHVLYGRSAQWSTSIDQVPTDLSSDAFEAWLWKEQPAQGERQHADLRDDAIFPTFQGLPYENDLDLDYFEAEDGYTYRPRKHWCFLAEIVDTGALLRLELGVRDKADRRTRVLFYTDQRGMELDPSLVREGFTVAILYRKHTGSST